MKKFIGLMMAVCITATQLSALANDTLYLNEGGITIKDKTLSTRPGEKVTLLVTPATVDWLDESVRESRNGDDVVYFGDATVAADGSYSFEFYLPENGKYNVYLTEGNDPTKNGKPDKASSMIYINKSKNEQAVSKLKTAVGSSTALDITKVVDVLNDYSDGLGLYDAIFDDENYSAQETAKLVYNTLSQVSEYEPLKVIEIIEKAAVAGMINNSCQDTIKKYSYILFEDGSLYEESYAQDLYNYMKDKNVQNLTELSKLLDEAVIISNANNGSPPNHEIWRRL